MVDGLAALARGAHVRSRLSDEALIARAMLAGAARHRRHKRMRAAIGAGAAIAIAAAVLFAIWPAQTAVPVAAPARTTTARLPSGDVLTAREGTRFYVEADTRSERRVRLEDGAMLFDVRPLDEGARFVVQTPHVEITVVGTVFEVVVDRDGTIVRVFEGRVRAGDRSIGAGEEYAVGRAPALDRALTAQGYVAARARAEHPIAPVERPEIAERPSAAIGPPLPLAPSREPEAEPAAPRVRVRANRPSSVEDEPAERAPQAQPISVAELRTLVANGNARRALELIPEARARGASDAELLFVQADALRRLDRTSEAAASYDQAARALPAGERENAGYIAATLRLRRLNDARGAIDSLEASRARDAGSPLRERAMALAVAAYEAQGNAIRARAAAEEYLALYPNGGSAQELRRTYAP